MHQSLHLRQQIAQEAARLLVGGYVCNFSRARQRAARQVFRGRLSKQELPTFAEIQAFLLQLRVETGVDSHAPRHLIEELNSILVQMANLFSDTRILVEHNKIEHMILPGFTLRIYINLTSDLIEETLIDAGTKLASDLIFRNRHGLESDSIQITTQHLVLEVFSQVEQFHTEGVTLDEYLGLLKLSQRSEFEITETTQTASLLEWSYAFELLPLLSGVRVDLAVHPEGDLCYHAQQVYQLGYELEPYDIEFLEACLFHDLGYVRNYHAPQAASVTLLTGLATKRTLFFIAELPNAHTYLQTGQARNSLRKSEDFDLLLELARLDKLGRESGIAVPELDQIERYLTEY